MPRSSRWSSMGAAAMQYERAGPERRGGVWRSRESAGSAGAPGGHDRPLTREEPQGHRRTHGHHGMHRYHRPRRMARWEPRRCDSVVVRTTTTPHRRGSVAQIAGAAVTGAPIGDPLDEADRDGGVLGQPRRDDAADRAAPDHDVVELGHGRSTVL